MRLGAREGVRWDSGLPETAGSSQHPGGLAVPVPVPPDPDPNPNPSPNPYRYPEPNPEPSKGDSPLHRHHLLRLEQLAWS